MAGRISYLKLLRKIHFISSVFILSFALLFLFTGFVMTQGKLFPQGDPVIHREIRSFSVLTDTASHVALLQEIKTTYGLEGRVGKFERNHKNEITCLYARPGLQSRIRITNNCDSIYIDRTSQQTFGRVTARLHHIHGFHGGWIYVIWGVMFDLTAASFLLFSITGILIWIKLRKALRFGWFIILPIVLLTLIIILKML